jgi:hypothetical protein
MSIKIRLGTGRNVLWCLLVTPVWDCGARKICSSEYRLFIVLQKLLLFCTPHASASSNRCDKESTYFPFIVAKWVLYPRGLHLCIPLCSSFISRQYKRRAVVVETSYSCYECLAIRAGNNIKEGHLRSSMQKKMNQVLPAWCIISSVSYSIE